MDEKPPQITLTIFLIKAGETTADLFLPTKSFLNCYTLKDEQQTIGYLYVKKPHSKPPMWGRFFKDYVDTNYLGKASSTAAVFVVKVDERWFAITFGQGRFLLKPECWEERFGLLVSLNSVGQNQIKSIDKQTFDALSTHSKIQSSQEAAPQEFGLDVEQDLVRAVTGSPIDRQLGHRLTGMDALRVSASVAVEQLPQLLARYQTQFHSKSYKKQFPWVDHLSEVTRSSLKEDLDTLLVEQIRAASFEHCWMAVPEIIEWAGVDGFRYGFTKKNPKHHDIHFPEFLEEMRDPENISIDRLRQRQVYCIGDNDHQINRWSVYRCIYCELDYDKDTYLLSGGKWYCVTRDFVQEVNESFNRIPEYANALPEYDDNSEGEYNERVTADDTYALMDKKKIMYGGGHSNFEFCDLYTKDKDIIHVKRYGQSAVFSHFFAQGTNSGELFHTQSEFRKLVNDKLPRSHKIKDSSRRPEPEEYQVVFAIVSDSQERQLTLPFFSRLNLRAAVRRLEGYGYRVALTKIYVNPVRSKKKRYVVV